MKLASEFVTKFASSIIATLCCFDRVIFKGPLPFYGERYLNNYVDHVLRMRCKDFLALLSQKTDQLVEHAKAVASQHGRPYKYLQGKPKKEKIIQGIIRDEGLLEGLVAVLCCMETCRTVRIQYGKRRPRLRDAYRPQRVVYYYWLDREFGLIYVRIQTWVPFTIQIYVNGHSWLAKQLAKRGLSFTQRDNAFTRIEQPGKTQAIAEGFSKLSWVRQLNRWARQANPLLKESWLKGKTYYWVIDQAEFSTDVVFSSRQKLSMLYQRLLDHATVNFSARDILTFLGRKLHGLFEGEVLTDCKKDRWPGARIKHRMKNNWLKMYDKFGQILRIETVINDPSEFRVRRQATRNGHSQMMWCPMNKGVSNFFRFHEVSHAANRRYLDALTCVNDPAPAYRQVQRLVRAQSRWQAKLFRLQSRSNRRRQPVPRRP